MKKLEASFLLLFSIFPALSSAQSQITPSPNDPSKEIVVFFSRPGQTYTGAMKTEGNTKIVANMVKEALGSDVLEIVPVEPYPVSYDETIARFKKERDSNVRPKIKTDKDINGYDIIFLGYPIWGGHLPPPVLTWIEGVNLQGKTIIPFSTSGGSGLGVTPRQLKGMKLGAEIKDGFTIYGQDAQNQKENTRNTIRNWLKSEGYLK